NLWVKLKDRIGEKMVVKWDEEVTSLVGIQICVTENGFCLQQPSLIRKLLSNDGSGMTVPTPLVDISLVSNPATVPDTVYLLHIGTLLYIAQGTRCGAYIGKRVAAGLSSCCR
ncbi:hypothetical protein VP01_13066g1, partial [Puccinia sorghi]